MDFAEYEAQIKKLFISDRDTPKKIGYLLVHCHNDFPDDWENKKLQLVSHFPQKKQQTIANLESICAAYDEDRLPSEARISQMDTCKVLPEDKRYEYINWAVENDAGRDEILDRMESESLRIPRTGDAEKYVMDAIKKLDKALPLADEKLRDAIKLAKPALEDGLK